MNLNGSVVVQRQLKPSKGKLRVIKLRLSFSRDQLSGVNLALLDSTLPWTDWVRMDVIPSEGKLMQVIKVENTSFEKVFAPCQDLSLAWQAMKEQFLSIVEVQTNQADIIGG